MIELPIFRLLITTLIYLGMFVLSSSYGLIRLACYAYIVTLIPIIFCFVYFYSALLIRGFGAPLLLNGFCSDHWSDQGRGEPANDHQHDSSDVPRGSLQHEAGRESDKKGRL